MLFIATHKDKLQSEQQLQQIDQELQETVKKTIAFKDNMIVFHSESQMVFDLNNISDKNDDIQQVRNAVERIGTHSEDYRIRTPYPWMIFAITLRHLPGKVISIDECMLLGKECGIDSREELNDALWFLHHNVGIIRHFQEIPDLQDVIIKEPEYIFDKLTELVIDTFTFEDLGPYMHEEFTKKGFISTDKLKELPTESDALDGDKFTVLLEHLRIIAPIEEDGKVVKYFIPCALTHAELPPDTQPEAVIPPMLITFESGYCPKGLFGSLIVELLKKGKVSQFDWKLKQDRIYRNQIYLSIGPYDSFCFSLSPTHVQVDCISSLNLDGRLPLGEVCCHVRHNIMESVELVTKKLHYTQKAAHSLAFTCHEPHHTGDCHTATINFHKGKACTMTCSKTGNQLQLPKGYKIWFNEVRELVTT